MIFAFFCGYKFDGHTPNAAANLCLKLQTRSISGTQRAMKRLVTIIGIVCLAGIASGAIPEPDLIAKVYFAGTQKMVADPNHTAFTNEFCSAEAVALRAQTAAKLSAWLAGWLEVSFNTTVPNGAAKLRPLFDDLQSSEWFLEARTANNGRSEVALAIRLAPVRAQVWQDSLKPFLPGASFKLAGGWLIFDSEPSLLQLGDRLARKISVPPPGWLNLDINWPNFAGRYPFLKELALPETQFDVTVSNAAFHVDGKFLFPHDLAINLEPWQVPTNAIRAPFDSFTAVRGFAPWLQSQTWTGPWHLSPAPNQLFVWSLPSHPLQTFAAVPVPEAAKALSQLYTQLTPAASAAYLRGDLAFPVVPKMADLQISFPELPYISPTVRAWTKPSGQFLSWETIPNSLRGSQPLPPALFARLAKKNVVFFHWEITSSHLPNLLPLTQYGLMLTHHKELTAESAALKWLRKTEGTLGHTDTEITESGPAELTFARNAPGIFTAAEFYVLANWLEAANFPGCDLREPPLPARVLQKRAEKMQGKIPFQLSTPGK